jgi:hypothetical protein
MEFYFTVFNGILIQYKVTETIIRHKIGLRDLVDDKSNGGTLFFTILIELLVKLFHRPLLGTDRACLRGYLEVCLSTSLRVRWY